MSDSQRRLWCRLIFLMGCLMPTAGVIYFGMHRPTTEDWEQQILAHCGLATQITAVETPEPGRTILRGVRITDPAIQLESPIHQIEVHTWGTPKRLIVRQTVGLAGNSLNALADRLQDRWLTPVNHSTPSSPEEWRVEFEQITLYQGEVQSALPPLNIQKLSLVWNRYEQGRQAIMKFLLHEKQGENEFVELTAQHQPGGSNSLWNWNLNTHACQLPTWCLAGLIPELQTTGANCSVQGSLQLQQQGRTFHGEILFRLNDLDLQAFGTPFRLPLRGLAAAGVAAKIRGNQLQELECQISAAQGSASRTWLQHLVELIGAEVVSPATVDNLFFKHGTLSFRFQDGLLHIEPDGLQLIAANGEHLVSQAAYPVAGLEDCVRRLASQTEPSEQVTNAMVRLLGHFDLPPVTRQAREQMGTSLR